MPRHPRPFTHQTSKPGIAALIAGLCLLGAPAANAHRRAQLETTVGEQTTTGALSEPTSPPTTPTETSAPTRAQERREAREARRARREAQVQQAQALAPTITITSPTAGTPLFVGALGPQGGGGTASASSVTDVGVTFTGTVSPAEEGTTVVLERESGTGRWHRIGAGVLDAEGSFSISHVFTRPGAASIRVLLRAHGHAMHVTSAPVIYQIMRHGRRRVTIATSADPVASGTQVTITGTVAGASGQKVTLLAQTSAGGPFTPVAEGVTTGDEYSFTQTPLVSTRYRVQSGSYSSAVLPLIVTPAPALLTPTPAPVTPPTKSE